MRHRPAAILLIAIALGCDSPSAPRTDASPFAGPSSTTYRVSGLVTDEAGVPIPGVRIAIDQGPRLPDLNEQTKRATTSTGPDGRYQIVLSGEYVETPQPVFGLIKAWTTNGVYDDYAYLLDGQGTGAVRNIRLTRTRSIGIGESVEVVVGPDSPLCGGNRWIFRSTLSLTTICESFVVRHGDGGTIGVHAHGTGSTVPSVRGGPVFVPDTSGNSSATGNGSVSFHVTAEDVTWAYVEIGLPIGTSAQRYVVSTSWHEFRP